MGVIPGKQSKPFIFLAALCCAFMAAPAARAADCGVSAAAQIAAALADAQTPKNIAVTAGFNNNGAQYRLNTSQTTLTGAGTTKVSGPRFSICDVFTGALTLNNFTINSVNTGGNGGVVRANNVSDVVVNNMIFENIAVFGNGAALASCMINVAGGYLRCNTGAAFDLSQTLALNVNGGG
ncbi:MAG: hypothetical protein LBR90_01185 [Elusimicrobiota bacterium]|nr:hypothetical protein [Elusimicrobiota bacterium]